MYYGIFLTDNPNRACPKSGHAAYGDSVRPVPVSASLSSKEGANYPEKFPEMMIKASNFMGFHTILKTSKGKKPVLDRLLVLPWLISLFFLDYYEALRWARKLTDELEHTINKGKGI